MTMTRNHEEEVGLRLQFEKKLNKLNADYRELSIKQARSVQQLQSATQHVDRLERLVLEQSE